MPSSCRSCINKVIKNKSRPIVSWWNMRGELRWFVVSLTSWRLSRNEDWDSALLFSGVCYTACLGMDGRMPLASSQDYWWYRHRLCFDLIKANILYSVFFNFLISFVLLKNLIYLFDRYSEREIGIESSLDSLSEWLWWPGRDQT